jgi:hypothetical protein
MNTESPMDWDEMFEYRPGTVVELRRQPGRRYEIDRYQATLVPPIWLVDDPRPRYPHELRRILSRRQDRSCELALEPLTHKT